MVLELNTVISFMFEPIAETVCYFWDTRSIQMFHRVAGPGHRLSPSTDVWKIEILEISATILGQNASK